MQILIARIELFFFEKHEETFHFQLIFFKRKNSTTIFSSVKAIKYSKNIMYT